MSQYEFIYSNYIYTYIQFNVRHFITYWLYCLLGEKDTVEKPADQQPPEEDFPLTLLARLDEQLGRPKWVVPVRPKDELEMLIRAAIKLSNEGNISSSQYNKIFTCVMMYVLKLMKVSNFKYYLRIFITRILFM